MHNDVCLNQSAEKSQIVTWINARSKTGEEFMINAYVTRSKTDTEFMINACETRSKTGEEFMIKEKSLMIALY